MKMEKREIRKRFSLAQIVIIFGVIFGVVIWQFMSLLNAPQDSTELNITLMILVVMSGSFFPCMWFHYLYYDLMKHIYILIIEVLREVSLLRR